jgi:hypothetical protein
MKAQAKRWADSDDAAVKYKAARAEAQKKADDTGFDYGIERNDLMRCFSVMMLPKRANRYGHELRVEVVSATTLAKCMPGHGPCA